MRNNRAAFNQPRDVAPPAPAPAALPSHGELEARMLAGAAVGPPALPLELLAALIVARERAKRAAADGRDGARSFSSAEAVMSAGVRALKGTGLMVLPWRTRREVRRDGNYVERILVRDVLVAHVPSGEQLVLLVEYEIESGKSYAAALTGSLVEVYRSLLALRRASGTELSPALPEPARSSSPASASSSAPSVAPTATAHQAAVADLEADLQRLGKEGTQ